MRRQRHQRKLTAAWEGSWASMAATQRTEGCLVDDGGRVFVVKDC